MRALKTNVNYPNDQLVWVALEAIGGAIRDLHQPRGRAIVTDVFGEQVKDIYATDTSDQLLEVTEDLIGAAFVLAQTWITATRKKALSATAENVLHVANYWKHRDTWDVNWIPGKNRIEAGTIAAVRALGAAPPTVLRQLTSLAEAALKQRFSVEALWAAIS